jgi:hypothetical protein
MSQMASHSKNAYISPATEKRVSWAVPASRPTSRVSYAGRTDAFAILSGELDPTSIVRSASDQPFQPISDKRSSWLFGSYRRRKSGRVSVASTATAPDPALKEKDKGDQGERNEATFEYPMIEPTPETDLPEWMALAKHAVSPSSSPSHFG